MKKSLLLSAVALLGVPALSHAGFTASTNSFSVSNTSSILTAGNTISTTTAGHLVEFNPDTANDPQITTDIASYRFSLTASTLTGSLYTGTYLLSYDFAGGIQVSKGTATFTVSPTSGRLAILDGSLVQDAVGGGPGNPAFTDLAAKYNYNPILINGTFTQKALDPTSGTLEINFEQTAQAVPEPASLAALGLGAVGLLRRRRKA